MGDLNGVGIMQWVSTAYILLSTLVMPIYGKFGDLVGRKRLLMAALALYAAGKMICGLSVNMGMLISGRLISGLGGGGLIILSQATLSDVVPPRKLGTYMGVIGAVFAVSNVLGPLLGGWFVQVTGWRWIFCVHRARGPACRGGTRTHAAPRRPRPRKAPHRLAWHDGHDRGCDLARARHGLGRHAHSLWKPCRLWALFALAVAAAVVFVLLERRAAGAYHSRWGFSSNRNFVRVHGHGACSSCIGIMGALVVPAHVLPNRGRPRARSRPGSCARSTMTAGVLHHLGGHRLGGRRRPGATRGCPSPSCAVSGGGSRFCCRACRCTRRRCWCRCVYLFVLGFGMGLGHADRSCSWCKTSFPRAIVGTATAANNFFRQIGASVGTALVGALFTMRLTADVAGKLTHVDNLSLATLTPQIVDKLPASAQLVIAAGYSDALLPLFLWFVPLMLACLVMMLLLKRHPLATTINHGGAGK